MCLWWPRKTTKNKTQQYSIMLFVKPNRKALCSFANPNRKTLQSPTEKHYAFWKSTEFIRCLCRWHDRKNEQQVWHIFVCRCEQFVWSYFCWFTNNCLLCWMQKQKCILCFDTETKVFDATTKMYSLFWYNNKNVYSTTDGPIKTTTNTEQHFVFWNTDNLQTYDVCFDANKCVLRPIKDLLKAFWRPFRGLWKAF